MFVKTSVPMPYAALRRITFLAPLLAGVCVAQTDVRGTVSDSSSGERIPYANIVVAGATRGVAANAVGFYLLPSMPAGTYEITATAVGFQPLRKSVDVRGTTPITLNFLLKPQAVELEEVVVSGRAKPEQMEVQTSVHIVDKMELQRVPISGQADILRSLQILPGIVSTSDVNTQFYVRGGSGDQNLFLLDGMRIYNPFHAFGLFGSIDPDIIRTAEIYTGAFPADFGGRLSSVVNMVSRDGNASRFAGEASMNLLSTELQLEGPLSENVQLLFSGRKSLFSETFTRFFKSDVPLVFHDAFLKLTMKDSESQNRYGFRGFISEDRLLGATSADPDYRWSTSAFSVTSNVLSTDRMFWDVAVSAGSFGSERSGGNVQGTSNKVTELGLRTDITYYTDSRDLILFGFEFYFPNAQYQFINRLGVPSKIGETLPELSVWIRHQLRSLLLKADIGLRVDAGSLLRWGDAASAIQPRVSFSYHLTDLWLAKLSFGRFSQSFITVTNEDDVLPVFTPWIVIPKDLQPERADHYVAGFEGPVAEGISTNIQFFYKDYGSLVSYNRDRIEPSDPEFANAVGESYGTDALLRYSHPFVDAYVAYTFTRVILNLNGFRYSPRYDRRHTVNALMVLHPWAALDISFRWEFGSGLPFTRSVGFYDRLTLSGRFPDPFYEETGTPIAIYGDKNSARLPAYHRMDVSLRYRLRLFGGLGVAAGASVVNVYDQQNIFYFDRRTGRRYTMLGFFPSASVSLEYQP